MVVVVADSSAMKSPQTFIMEGSTAAAVVRSSPPPADRRLLLTFIMIPFFNDKFHPLSYYTSLFCGRCIYWEENGCCCCEFTRNQISSRVREQSREGGRGYAAPKARDDQQITDNPALARY